MVGGNDGLGVGAPGSQVGAIDGNGLGNCVGVNNLYIGIVDGLADGKYEGLDDGCTVGEVLGLHDGDTVSPAFVGADEGDRVGFIEGY